MSNYFAFETIRPSSGEAQTQLQASSQAHGAHGAHGLSTPPFIRALPSSQRSVSQINSQLIIFQRAAQAVHVEMKNE